MIKIHNSASFTEYVEAAVRDKDLTYLEAISDFCTSTGVEMETIPRLISPQIKEKLEAEAYDLNMFRNKKKKRKKIPLE